MADIRLWHYREGRYPENRWGSISRKGLVNSSMLFELQRRLYLRIQLGYDCQNVTQVG